MATIPLPALDIKPPAAPPDPMAQYGKLMQLRNMMGEQQMQQGQQQLQQQQIQQNQNSIDQTKAVNQAFQGAMTTDANGMPQFDQNKVAQSVAAAGHGSVLPALQKSFTELDQGKATLLKTQGEVQSATQDYLGSLAASIKQTPKNSDGSWNMDLVNPLLAHAASIPGYGAKAVQLQQQMQQDPQHIDNILDQVIANSPKQQELINAKTTADARALASKTEADKFAATKDPTSSLYAPSQASVALGTAPGAPQIQAGEATLAGKKAAAEAAARQPFELALAKAKQVIQDGDPNSAAQLLISGDVAPSMITSSRKPEFAQKAFQAAHNISNGTWNAQKAEGDFQVARSPANLGFFGSAKSLTDKGGTLDQLANTGKDIPQNQLPVFNTVADAVKAASGSGPIAKYASLALGVADDYSKVMGGGQGSDTSRTQALQLISAKQSPEQRAASIEGIRGAVGSQMNSRIGNNSVLQRMYGAGAPQGGNNQVAPIYATNPQTKQRAVSNDGGKTWQTAQ